MTYGEVFDSRFCAWKLSFWLALSFLIFSPHEILASSQTQSETVTIVAVGSNTVQVMREDGQCETVAFNTASAFLRQGLLVRAEEFLPGETALLRRHKGVGGVVQIGLMSDPDSAAVIEKYRGRPLSGTLLSLSPQVWVVQPSDGVDSVPLSLLVSARTQFRVGTMVVTASAFGPGAEIRITTREMPSGLLSVISVSDPSGSDRTPETPRRAGFVSGLVTEVQSSTVTVQDKAAVSHTIAVDGATRIKVRRQAATLSEVILGMSVSAWLGSHVDFAGNPIATSLSAYDSSRNARKKKR